jgi:hypothetical protein
MATADWAAFRLSGSVLSIKVLNRLRGTQNQPALVECGQLQ